MASMRELAMELLSRSGSGPVLQPTNVYGQDPDLPIGYGEGEISPLDAAAMSTMLVPGVGDVTGLAADVDMYMRDPESRNIPNYLLTAAGALPFLPAASQVRQGIKAYHGSPHNMPRAQRYINKETGKNYVVELDNPVHMKIVSDTSLYEPVGEPSDLGMFDVSKIGTGEGAQAYGRGLYFAESEDVARGYKNQLSARNSFAQAERDFIKSMEDSGLDLSDEGVTSDSLYQFSRQYVNNDGDLSETLKDARRTARLLESDGQDASEMRAVIKAIEKSERLGFKPPSVDKGSMYEVNIDVEPDELLDWDKPMAEQSALVKQAFNFDPPPKPNFTAKDVTETGSSNPSYKYSVGQFPAAATIEEALSAANKPVLMHTGPTGSVAYKKYEQALSDPMSDPTGAITAAQNLQEKGIKGIRYADAFTRHKTPDKRSMNYVIFDDRLITIAKKYGIAIPAAAAMLARMTGEDTSQSYQEET